MAYTITIPFHAFKLQFFQENTIRVPMMDADAIRLNEPFHLLAGKYAEIFQRKILNKGNYQQILNEYVEGEYYQDTITIGFPAAKDGISYPNFDLTFDYFFNELRDKGYWGIVPVLGVETFANSIDKLLENLEDAIHLEFARKQRLKSVHAIIASIWHDAVVVEQQHIDFRFPSLKELEALQDGKQDLLLPKIAQKIKIERQVVYGRKEALNQLEKALKGKFNRNVLLVGASGVGKTALVWEIIRQQKERKIEGDFWETTASVMIKELTGNTGWQDGLAIVCRELASTKDVLFVRNFMELFEVGQYEGNSVSMSDYMRSFIGRGEVTLISECTEEEMARIELRSPNYLSLFQLIRLEEPRKELETIIIKKVQDLAKNRRIHIDTEAIRETLRLNRRFTPYAGLPGKPIRFLESILINQKPVDRKAKNKRLARSEVLQYFCEETGMPLFMVDPEVPMNPAQIKKDFNNNVFGQERAVSSIVDLLASVKTALTKTGKPIASLLFVGPTGVGKTELAKVLAQFMFGNRDRMVRFDMSEYADPYSVMRLTGLNYGADGLLTAAVRRAPFCVLLFDEIEKAHPNFFDLLLQVLSEGRLTDSSGKLVNFCSTIIIMTSNIGAANLQSNRISLTQSVEEEAVTTHFMSAVQQFFRPELVGRIDEVIPFAPLSSEVIHYVVEREIDLFKKLEGIQFRRLELTLSEAVFSHLAKIGYSPEYGARQLQRTIKEQLIIPLAQALNQHDNEDQLIANVEVVEEKIVIALDADPLGLDLLLEELEKIDYADYASELRRNLAKLEEGGAFIRLLSEIEILERKKKKSADKFWGNQENAERYSYLLETKEHLRSLKERIEKHEESVSIAYMGLTTYDATIADQLKVWLKDLFQFKIELNSRINQAGNKTFLAIYGLEAHKLKEIYTQIAHKKTFKIATKTIWYREELYKATIPFKGGYEVDELLKGRYQKKEYVTIDFEAPNKTKFITPENGDILCGIVFKIEGACANLFFKGESGLHFFKTENPPEDKRFLVKATADIGDIPDGIHRKDFYSKIPIKRIYYPNLLEDKQEKWSLDIQKGDFSSPLLAHKDKGFEGLLNGELF